MELGVQLHLPTYSNSSLAGLLELARDATSVGVRQIWVTDNLQSRNLFVVLAALAIELDVKLGAATMVQYFRSPVEAADAIATISDLMQGRELSIAIARGNPYTDRLIEVRKPVTFLQESARCIKQLLEGGRVDAAGYPTLASYFNFAPNAAFQLGFKPTGPIRLYGAGNGPRALAIAGKDMDGVIFDGRVWALAAIGRLDELLAIAGRGVITREAGHHRPIGQVKISVARDADAARDFARSSAAIRSLGLRRRGYPDSDLQRLGIDPRDVDKVERETAEGASADELQPYGTDAMVDAMYVAGDPERCRARLKEIGAVAATHGFDQLMLSELGPDPSEALRLIATEVLPALNV